MRTVTQQFLDAITKSHRLSITCDVMLDDEVIVPNLPLAGGSVTVDAGSDIRYTCSVTVSDIAYLPRDPTDPLAPYGNRLRIRRGIRYTNGQVERVPVGLFAIDEPGGDMNIGPLTVSGRGLESVLQANTLTDAFSCAGTDSHVDAITDLVTAVMPTQVIDSAAVTGDQPPASKTWDQGADRWAACRELARAVGCEIFFDAEGTLVIRPFPPPPAEATPVWTVSGGTGGVLVAADMKFSLSGVYNGVRAMSDGNALDGAVPVSAQVVDDDPASPTRWGGPIGKRLKTIKSPLYQDFDQCNAAAVALLPTVLGANRAINLRAVPNPALEAGDCIRVVYGDGYAELHTVQSLTIPLDVAGDFSIATRSGTPEEATP